MIKNIIWALVFILAAALLQSTVLSRLIIYIQAIPDLTLGILIYIAYVNGTMTGQVSGFFSGLLLDFLSAAPLGLNCLVRTLIGALAGLFRGAFFLDVFFLPFILCSLATLLKAAIYFILNLLLGPAVPVYSLVTPLFWVELGLNSLSAPLLFGLLKRVRPLSPSRDKT